MKILFGFLLLRNMYLQSKEKVAFLQKSRQLNIYVRYCLSIVGILFFTPLIKSHSIIEISPIATNKSVGWFTNAR